MAGDVLVFYCSGLGVTNPPVVSGALLHRTTLAQTQPPVTASIGGVNA